MVSSSKDLEEIKRKLTHIPSYSGGKGGRHRINTKRPENPLESYTCDFEGGSRLAFVFAPQPAVDIDLLGLDIILSRSSSSSRRANVRCSYENQRKCFPAGYGSEALCWRKSRENFTRGNLRAWILRGARYTYDVR